MRILIAEDETIIRLDLRKLLEEAGHEVCAEARDGVEAVELVEEHNPDLAILDVKMPRLDGIEAAKRILEERPIPIVMLTAYGQDELVARAVEAGVFGYLVKPFREADLLPAIATARARHEELTQFGVDALTDTFSGGTETDTVPFVTFAPGVAGATAGAQPPTTTTTSLDGGLEPHAFRARIRT